MKIVGNIIMVTQRAPPFVFVLDATVRIIIEVMIDILSLKNFTLILRYVISGNVSRDYSRPFKRHCFIMYSLLFEKRENCICCT